MIPRLPQPLGWLLLSSFASAQYTIDQLSFGDKGVVSPDGRGAQGWSASSVNHNLNWMSDRVILTPPVPGNAKGALWSDASTSTSDWTVNLDFRASGQESGSGNLNLWYTKDKDRIGTDSVYNAEKFDGLVLVIDQYGGTGGKIRGFLNDGSQNFRTHSSLEALAFGHCDYSYRNLGRPSRLKLSNTNGLTVSVDDKVCFSTQKVSLPSGYYFGITASTGENPDSFEVLKFHTQAGFGSNSQPQGQVPVAQRDQPQLQKLDAFPGAPEYVPDRDAEDFKSQADQFTDLHNRIQGLQHQIANMFLEFKGLSDKLDAKHNEMLVQVQNAQGSRDTGLPPDIVGKINRMNDKIESMDRVLNTVKGEVEGKDYRQHLNELNTAIANLHGGLTEHLPDRILDIMRRHSPQFGMLVFIVVGVQVVLAGAYVVYKRRRHSSPKKFL